MPLAACQEIFTESAMQLCIWHIVKNVAFQVKLKCNGTSEGTELERRMAARGGKRREDYDAQNRASAAGVTDGLLEHRD